MRYYFTAQTHGISDKVKARYRRIMDLFEQHGHTNINPHQMASDDPRKQKTIEEIGIKNIQGFDSQTRVLTESEALVCDVTEHSATVGYQVHYALENKIPCLALFFKNEATPGVKPSAAFSQPRQDLLRLVEVESWDGFDNIIDNFHGEFINKPFKFNFYIPLSLYNDLSRESTRVGKTKSELLRELIVKYLNNAKKKRKD